MSDADRLQDARRLNSAIASNPKSAGRFLPGAIELLVEHISEDVWFDERAAEIRSEATGAVLRVCISEPDVLDDDPAVIETLVHVIEQQQFPLTRRSRSGHTTKYHTLVRESQQNLLLALEEYVRFADDPQLSWAAELLPTIVDHRADAETTAYFLDLYEACIRYGGASINIDLDRLQTLLTSGERRVMESVVDVYSSIYAHHELSLSDQINLFDQVLKTSRGTVVTALIRLLGEIAREDPYLVESRRDTIEDHLDDRDFETRLEAMLALLELPHTNKQQYERQWTELHSALASSNLERRNLCINVLSNHQSAQAIEHLPLDPLIDALGSENRYLVLSASQLLTELGERAHERFDQDTHVDRIVTILESTDSTDTYVPLTVLLSLAYEEPKLLVPHTETIAHQLRGPGKLSERHMRRMEGVLDVVQQWTDAGPEVQVTNKTLRREKARQAIINRGDIDADSKSLSPYVSAMILMRISTTASEEVAEHVSDIILGLTFDQPSVRSAVLFILDSLSENHPELLYPHLGYIIEQIRTDSSDGDEAWLTFRSLLVLYRTLVNINQDIGDQPRDITQFFDILDIEPPSDEQVALLFNRVATKVIQVALFRYCISPERMSQMDFLEDSRIPTHVMNPKRTDITVDDHAIQRLLNLGHTDDLYIRTCVIQVFVIIAMISSEQVLPHLPTIFDWLDDVLSDHTPEAPSVSVQSTTLTTGANLSVEDESFQEIIGRLAEVFSENQLRFKESFTWLLNVISIHQPAGLLPHLDYVLELSEGGGTERTRTVMSCVEELLICYPRLGTRFVRTASRQLSKPDLTVREEAARILCVVAEDCSSDIADEMAPIVATLLEATSDAMGLFLARTVSVVSETHPSCVRGLEDHLRKARERHDPAELRHRDSPYDRLEHVQLLTEDPEQNREMVRRLIDQSLSNASS